MTSIPGGSRINIGTTSTTCMAAHCLSVLTGMKSWETYLWLTRYEGCAGCDSDSSWWRKDNDRWCTSGAFKVDSVNANQAGPASANECDTLSASALSISDSGTFWCTSLDLLAPAAVVELVDELDIGIEFRRDLHLADRETSIGANAESSRSGKIFCCSSLDDSRLLKINIVRRYQAKRKYLPPGLPHSLVSSRRQQRLH